jgi:hypothetical protein
VTGPQLGEVEVAALTTTPPGQRDGAAWFFRGVKSLLRGLAGREDPWRQFRRLESAIHPGTWASQEQLGAWLAALPTPGEDDTACAASPDALVRRGWDLRGRLRQQFQDKWSGSPWRVLIFLPDYEMAPAGYSLFRNLADGFAYLGVPARLWPQGEPLGPHLDSFQPTVLLANDGERYAPEGYLDYIDWRAVADYRKRSELWLGLVASPYPKAAADLDARLAHARRLGVTFYFAFQAEEFIAARHEGYRRRGFPVLSLEFGANPLVYYPVAGCARDLNYVFLGSAHFEKWSRYHAYFKDILAAHPGVLVGTGWSQADLRRLPETWHRHLYARARVGLNLHVPFQIEAASELNERAYNLAACGVPQLSDAPKLLPWRFRAESVFVGPTPAEYRAQFRRILARPDQAQERALNALEDVLQRHTIFHRAEAFLGQVADAVLGGAAR